jgi:hypothetical protein
MGREQHGSDPTSIQRTLSGLNREKGQIIAQISRMLSIRIRLRMNIPPEGKPWRSKGESIASFIGFSYEMTDSKVLVSWLLNLERNGINPDDCLPFIKIFFKHVSLQRPDYFIRNAGSLNHLAMALGRTLESDKKMAKTSIEIGDGIIAEKDAKAAMKDEIDSEIKERLNAIEVTQGADV